MGMPQLENAIRARRHAIKKMRMRIVAEAGLGAAFNSQLEHGLPSSSLTSPVVIGKAIDVITENLIRQSAHWQSDAGIRHQLTHQ